MEAEDDTYLVVAHPELGVAWSPPPALATCFDTAAIEAARDLLTPGFHFRLGMPIEWHTPKLRTWADLGAGAAAIRGPDPRPSFAAALFGECVLVAHVAGMQPDIQYVVRVRQRRDGSADVSFAAAYGLEIDTRLRCCLEGMGEALSGMLIWSEELRSEGGTHGRGTDIVARWTR
jgi:hypothetical protein